jgi:hypothetical protein
VNVSVVAVVAPGLTTATRVDEHAVRAVRTCHDQLDLLGLSKKDTDAVIGSPPIDRRPLTAEHEIPPRSQG